MSTNPDEVLEPPEQIEVQQQAPINDEELEKVESKESPPKLSEEESVEVASKRIDLVPSEDLDLSNVKSKPPPREPVEPTFRGWKEVGGWEQGDALTADDETIDLLSRASIFDTYLPSIAYGDWYHNGGYLALGALLSWIVGWFRLSLAPIFVIMTICCVLYRSSVRRYRTLLREQAQREFSIKVIEDDYETMDWLNTLLEKFWYFLEPSVSQIICEQVNPILAESPAPAFIKALWIDSFTAGTKPPRIDAVKTLQGTDEDVVVMDWGFSFTPNALPDSNTKQMKNNVNQKVVVKASIFGIPVSVAVSEVSFRAMARVRLRMMATFPHVETLNVSLLDPPHFDFNCKVLGDSIFNWEVLAIPGLYPFINEMVKRYVGPMLFTPLSFQLNIQQLMAGHSFDSAIGVLAITSRSARGLKGFSTLGTTLDPYLTFGFQKDVLAKTKVKKNTSRPIWNETVYIPIRSLSEPLNISVIDYNEFRDDRQVGSIQFDLEVLHDEHKHPNLTAPVIRNNKPVGELQFGLHFMPTIEPGREADGAIIPPPDLNTGIARIEIVEARHLKSGGKAASTYVELYFNKEKVLTTGVKKNTNSPAWSAPYEKIVENRAKAKVRVVVKTKSDKVLGQVYASLNELIDASQVDQTWFPLAKGGEIRIRSSWKPVALENASGAGGYTPPIGVVRINVEKADDLLNLETIGKVDPYARILINGFQRARTVAVNSSLNPTWNEIHYVSVSSPNQKLTIEVMDFERRSADRTLGLFDVKLNEIISKNEKGQYIEYIDQENRESKLIHKKGPKGTVTYSLSFYPTLPVMTLDDMKEEEEEKAKKAEEAKKADKAQKEKEKTAEPEEEENESGYSSKLKLSLDELIEYKSGVLVYEVIEAEFGKEDIYLQAFFDNHGHYDYVTQKLKKKNVKICSTGDAIIRELEWSKVCFRLTKDKEDNRVEKAIAETTIPTLQLLKNAYHNPSTITLHGSNNATFTLQCSWIPIIYETGLPPSDSINNSGILNVDIISAENLIASDRSGKSDPYIELYLNTDKEPFYKTKKIKKTLDPVWHESTSVQVVNKYDSVIKVVCMDWDMGPESDDLLGIGYIKLSDLDIQDRTADVSVPLTTEDDGDGGVAHFKFSFKPEFVLSVQPASSTNIGEAFGTVGNIGLGVSKGVTVTVGRGLGGGVKAFKKGLSLGKSE